MGDVTKTVAAALGCEAMNVGGNCIGIRARNAHGELEAATLWNSEGGIWSRLAKLAQDNANLRHDIERFRQTAAEERRRIVAWHRTQAVAMRAEAAATRQGWHREKCEARAECYEHAANAIEAGEHEKEGARLAAGCGA